MIRQANVTDLEQINELLDIYELNPVDESIFLDLCLVSDVGGHVVGFIWAAIPPSKYIAYVDYMTVHPQAKGHGFLLCSALLKIFKEWGVKRVITMVRRDGSQSSIKSHSINLKTGLYPQEHPYTFFMGDVETMHKNLEMKDIGGDQWVQ